MSRLLLRRPRAWLTLLALPACGGAAPAALDTSCPGVGATPELLFAAMAQRGLPGSPDTLSVRVGGQDIVVGWKNLLSGRELTLSCAYRRHPGGWRLLRARLDEGTHTVRITGRAEPPALIYRDASGRLLDVVAVEPNPESSKPIDD